MCLGIWGALTPHQRSAPYRAGGGWCGRTGGGFGVAELGAKSDLGATWLDVARGGQWSVETGNPDDITGKFDG